MVKFKIILDFIIYVLKILIYFDTKYVKLQTGGASNNAKDEPPPEEEEKTQAEKEAEESGGAGFLWIITFLKEIVMGVLKWFGDKIMRLISMLLFASIAPIIPFFVSMAGMFGVLKYFMFKLRRF